MGRVLSLDYGSKKTGIAVTDILHLSINPIPYQETNQLVNWLQEYLEAEDVDEVVIGYPTHADGNPTKLCEKIDKLVNLLNAKYKEIKVVKRDESFSSKEGAEMMKRFGFSKTKRKEKGLLDSYSACIILNEYLEENR